MALRGAYWRLTAAAAAVTFASALALTIHPQWLNSLLSALYIASGGGVPPFRSSSIHVRRFNEEVLYDAPCDPDTFWPPASAAGGNTSWRDPHLLVNGSMLKMQWRVAGQVDGGGATYPISPEQFKRSFSQPDLESRCRWLRVAAALDAGTPIAIAVVGGSMTYGHESERPWSAFLDEWLQRVGASRGSKVTVSNLAEGGISGRQLGQMYCPGWKDFDAYIVDTGVNAELEIGAPQSREGISVLFECLLTKQPRSAALPAPLPPAIMYAESVDVDLRSYEEFPFSVDCSAVPARPGRPQWTNCPGNWYKSTVEGTVARELGLPVVSYRAAIWPEFDKPPEDMLLFWGQHAHPAVLTHELYSDMVKYALLHLLPQSLNATNATSPLCNDVP